MWEAAVLSRSVAGGTVVVELTQAQPVQQLFE